MPPKLDPWALASMAQGLIRRQREPIPPEDFVIGCLFFSLLLLVVLVAFLVKLIGSLLGFLFELLDSTLVLLICVSFLAIIGTFKLYFVRSSINDHEQDEGEGAAWRYQGRHARQARRYLNDEHEQDKDSGYEQGEVAAWRFQGRHARQARRYLIDEHEQDKVSGYEQGEIEGPRFQGRHARRYRINEHGQVDFDDEH